MKPATFDYVAVTDLDEALEALASDEEARILAGGQSLVPLMNHRLARPSLLVDLNRLSALDVVEVDEEWVRLGALCRHRRLERDPQVAEVSPLLAEAAGHIAHPQIRSRGTLGGSIAHGDPAAELPAALIALGASVRLRDGDGEREVAATDLFEGFFSTAIEPGEVVVDVSVPRVHPGDGTAFAEVAPRRGDFATAGVGVVLRRDADGRCTDARAGGCALASVPVGLTAALEPMIGSDSLSEGVLREMAERVVDSFEPVADAHVSAEDRLELAQLLLVETVRVAWERSGGTLG